MALHGLWDGRIRTPRVVQGVWEAEDREACAQGLGGTSFACPEPGGLRRGASRRARAAALLSEADGST
eukprot:7710535-Lingulodinium_polyedra.AAC.1